MNVCVIEGCQRNVYSKNMCGPHYNRNREGRPLDTPIQTKVKSKTGVCSIDNCERPHLARGFCRPHYERWKDGKDLNVIIPRRKFTKGKICEIENCHEPVESLGLCELHYERLRTGRDVHAPKPKPKLKRDLELLNDKIRIFELPWRDHDGYKALNAFGKMLMQHRVIWELHNGRKLEAFENIHHKNGIRDDNRIENLELWTKPQPCGQRPEDLIAWVLEHYREEVLRQIDTRIELPL